MTLIQQALVRRELLPGSDFGVDPTPSPFFDPRLLVDPHRVAPYDTFHNLEDGSGHIPRTIHRLASALNSQVGVFLGV